MAFFGEMSNIKLSNYSDYLQFCICGLNQEEALLKYYNYNLKNKPLIIHADWNKKGFSENNLKERKDEYIKIIKALKKETNVLGITIHPPSRYKFKLNEFLSICEYIKEESGVDVFIENRSKKTLLISTKEEIIRLSKERYMTIDIPQLFITCNFDNKIMKEVLNQINFKNIKEIHLANLKKTEKNTFVARKILDGDIDITAIKTHIKLVKYITLEILGGANVFVSQKKFLNLILGDWQEPSLFQWGDELP